MTEKNYNPEQKHAKATNKMEKMDKNISKKNEQKIADAPKEEIKKEQTEKTIEETKKVEEKKKIKKNEAMVKGLGIPISSKQAFAINKFIKYKEVGHAIKELEEILLHKKALPMKGEIPHRRGKGMMSGRYPKNALNAFIKLLKSLNANANVNEISSPVISEAFANFASMPYGKSGRVRKKRTNIVIVAKEHTLSKSGKEKKGVKK